MTMIERVARSLAGQWQEPEWELMHPDKRERFWADAYCAIEAMRKATDVMVIAGCRHENMGDMAGRWSAMIDAALGEPP